MDGYLALVSKRDERRYDGRPVPEEIVRRILDAGRVAGSARNRQPWRFLVLDGRDIVERVAETVYAPANVLAAGLVIVVVGTGSSFDVGRAAQNLMLAAWNDGILSCPNGMPDADVTARVLELGEERPSVVLSFGYPQRPRNPEARTPEEWIRRADRKPFDEVVQRIS